MIAQLTGVIARTEADYVVIDVNGVGYKVNMPLSILAQMPQVGERARLLISTVVREDSITLYGFSEEAEQSMFELLITVSGVGPKVGLNILSVMPVEQIVHAISSDGFHELNRVPGVGTKTAQRIVLELKEKIATLVWAQTARKSLPPEKRSIDDAIEGLVALGYSRNDARTAAEKALQSVADKGDTGSVITTALKHLSKG